MKLKLLALAALALAVSACAPGYSLSLNTPYGQVNADKTGAVIVPNTQPIVIPAK